jgi:hypothetical protein
MAYITMKQKVKLVGNFVDSARAKILNYSATAVLIPPSLVGAMATHRSTASTN